MGLEEVELVMMIEDEFGISIPDAVLEEARTVGQLYDTVMPLVRTAGDEKIRSRGDVDAFVWKRLCEISAKLASGVKASEIERHTRFTEDLGYG
jgi:hydrogenase maturation factor HypE